MRINKIELFAKSNNKVGDLFCRLMGDFFHAIGYDEPRYDIQKSGREIDLTAKHRIETKVAIAECKAHKDTIGGSDINKFIGALDAEKRKIVGKSKRFEVLGYFVSLSGFKETAVEQEKEFDDQRLILIDKDKIIKELIAGKIIVSIEKALSNLQIEENCPPLLDYVDLIAHEIGWIWVFYYGINNTASHFTFVHAEGNPLIETLSKKLIDFDSKNKHLFNGLKYLKNKDEKVDIEKLQNVAKESYFKYIQNECGNIHFEGLPTDKDAGSVKVELEKIFQPLHLEKINPTLINKNEFSIESETREPIGKILRKNTRLAILARPGGGKSTLLKRIAIAYSFHERLKLVDDNLPDKDWIPIFIRCRELGNYVTKSITEIIENIPNRAEIAFCKNGFSSLVSNALQKGNVLLLIDGLDEIAEDNNRLLFVNQLRTFLATYPNINIITTSREAGFRVIGGVLAKYCTHYKISKLFPNEIEELTIKWHKAIIDNSKKTEQEAIDLSNFILKDKRIHVLAENPLLLTTLLFVKRWAGYIPTKKSVLYEEMIKLLLVTWNIEGHEQLDIDEAEPQLSYVAFAMTEIGEQTITLDDLKKQLRKARSEMPDILGYTNVSVQDFIKRVESRSSLLILSGHKRLDNGKITPIYEFLHLSFQEYLTAKAVVEKFLPNNLSNKSNLEIIKSHIHKENWKEVIPLIAVLSKRGTNELIEYLIEKSKVLLEQESKRRPKGKRILPPELLGSCIANEIQINPDLLKVAIEWFAKNRYNVHRKDLVEIIANSKFSNLFFETICKIYFNKYDDIHASAIGGMIGEINFIRLKNNEETKSKLVSYTFNNILDGNKKELIIGLFTLMILAYENKAEYKKDISKKNLEVIIPKLKKLVKLEDQLIYYPTCWSIAWLGTNDIYYFTDEHEMLQILADNWLSYTDYGLSRISAWALFASLEFKSINFVKLSDDSSNIEKLKEKISNPVHEYDKLFGILFCTQLGIKFSINEIRESLKSFKNKLGNIDKLNNIAKLLNVEPIDNSEI